MNTKQNISYNVLHQVYTSCGRAFLVCLLALPVGFVSCEKDSDKEEEKTPASTDIDTNEVKGGDAQNAASRSDAYPYE